MYPHDIRASFSVGFRDQGEHRQRPTHVEHPRSAVCARRPEHVRVPRARREAPPRVRHPLRLSALARQDAWGVQSQDPISLQVQAKPTNTATMAAGGDDETGEEVAPELRRCVNDLIEVFDIDRFALQLDFFMGNAYNVGILLYGGVLLDYLRATGFRQSA